MQNPTYWPGASLLNFVIDGVVKLTKRKTSTGAARAKKRLEAERKATAKRIKSVDLQTAEMFPSRQVRRATERRQNKMPIGLPEPAWRNHLEMRAAQGGF